MSNNYNKYNASQLCLYTTTSFANVALSQNVSGIWPNIESLLNTFRVIIIYESADTTADKLARSYNQTIFKVNITKCVKPTVAFHCVNAMGPNCYVFCMPLLLFKGSLPWLPEVITKIFQQICH